LLAGVCPPFPGWLRAGQSNLSGPYHLGSSMLETPRAQLIEHSDLIVKRA